MNYHEILKGLHNITDSYSPFKRAEKINGQIANKHAWLLQKTKSSFTSTLIVLESSVVLGNSA